MKNNIFVSGITKEITRFARNVLDSIRYTRELLAVKSIQSIRIRLNPMAATKRGLMLLKVLH